MDYLNEIRGRATDNPDLHYLFLRWILDTYGEDWFQRSADWSMNWAVFGYRPQQILLIEFDDKKSYSRVMKEFGVFDISPTQPVKKLMSLNVADPEFFPQLKRLIDEFTPSTTLDELRSNESSARGTLRSSLADSTRGFS